tara:strand:- start:778 stop:1146 length:369 start_codon:yes stop_codon:yes gene_type:complete
MKKKYPVSNRSFGFTFAAFFLIIFLVFYFFFHEIKYFLLLFSITFLILGYINSNLLYPLNYSWMVFGLLISRITNPILIFVLYLFIFIPIGVLKNIFKRKTVNSSSYWVSAKDKRYDFNDQF